jgi:hypothetical protein
MFSRSGLFGFVLCALVFSAGPLLFGQANGSFAGTVVDKTGSVITGATVRVTSQTTGFARETKTDDTGHYLIPLLPLSVYTLRVEAQGFQPVEQKDVRLQVNEQRELDFTMYPASVTSTIEVSATEVSVQTSNPTLGQVITEQQVAQLPLNGRDFVQLATLTPGTTQETNPNSFFTSGASSEVAARGIYSLSVGGSRAQSTDWLLDGVDNNELTAGGIAILPSIDAIQEFKVLTYNYSAEYGTRAGPTVLVSSKSGTNSFHGSVFEFFRNTSLDARSYFAAQREQFNLNQFGFALGGPIRKDKTFFFGDFQGKHQRHGIAFTGLVPTQAMMNGDFRLDPVGLVRGSTPSLFSNLVNPYATGTDPKAFQCVPGTQNLPVPISEPINGHGGQAPGVNCNVIPAALFDPIGQAMIQLYPQSTTPNPALGINYANVPVRKLDENSFDIRLDHNFSSKDSAFARFSYDQAASFVPGGSPGFAEANPFGSTQHITNHGRNAAISETHIFSPNNINQFSFGFNRIFNHIISFGNGTCEAAKLGIQGANLNSICPNAPADVPTQSTIDCVSCGLSSTEISSYWALGDRGFAPFQGGTNVFMIADSFDMIRGNHNIRLGGSIRIQQMNVRTNAFQDGFFLDFGGFSNDGAADLLLGQMGGGIHDQTFFGATTGRRWKLFRPYVQDDWRVTNSLTLNLGLAWALVTPTTEAENRQANFDSATGAFYVAGSSSLIAGCSYCVHSDGRVGIQMDTTAFEPRIGLAWKVMGSQTTVLRAGYAIYHDSSWNQGAQGLWENPPYFAESDNFPSAACPLGNTTMNCGLARMFLLSPNLQPITAPLSPSAYPGTVQSQNLNFKQGKVQQFNLNIEHQLPGNIVLTAGYAGSRSSRILVDGLNLNVGSPTACIGGANGYTLGCGPGGTAFAPPFGAPTFLFPLTIANANGIGRAHYDSLQIKAETKSVRHGLYGLFGYTYARTFDSGMPDGLGTFPGATYFPLPGYQKLDWALSQLNLNQQFTASVLYSLPFGKGKAFGGDLSGPANAIVGNWSVNAIVRATTGFPLFAVDSDNASGVAFSWNGNVLNRPDIVADPNKPGPVAANPTCNAPAKIHTLENWFNPCAFVHATPGELGDSNRSPMYGPRFVNTDLSIIKHFPIRESLGLDFRAEFFNIFNHPQFYLQGGASSMQDVNAPSSFGVVNGTVNNPRVIQFALKFDF